MSDARTLFVIGEPPLATLAVSIGATGRGTARVRVLDLAPDRISEGALDGLESADAESTDVFAAIGPSALNYARFDLWAKLRLHGFRCATLVHPRAFVDPDAVLGDNVLVGPGAIVESGARIGRGTILGSAAVVSAGANVGPWCWLASRSVVGAGAVVGQHSVIGSSVCLGDRMEFAGQGEISVPGAYSGKISAGTFIASEFPVPGARLVARPA